MIDNINTINLNKTIHTNNPIKKETNEIQKNVFELILPEEPPYMFTLAKMLTESNLKNFNIPFFYPNLEKESNIQYEEIRKQLNLKK